jgi:O-antigen ligase
MHTPEANILLAKLHINDIIIVSISFCFLFVSSIDDLFVGNAIKIFWLLSLFIVTKINFGAAIALYGVSVVIYSVHHFNAWGSFIERPDNFALIIILLSFFIKNFRKDILSKASTLGILILIFIVSALTLTAAQGLMTRIVFAEFMRTFGISLCLFLLLMISPISPKDARSFFSIIILFGLYVAAISIIERIGYPSYMIPPWIGDPALNRTIAEGRSGGPFLQSEFNGMALSMIFCIIWGAIISEMFRFKLILFLISFLCLIAIFFTYTRAAWLSAVLACLMFLIMPHSAAKKGVRRLMIISIGIILLSIVVMFPVNMAKERLGDAGTAYYRINVWVAGLRMVVQKPLFGYGIGQFQEKLFDYHYPLPSRLGSSLEYKEISGEGNIAHNTLLSILVEQGFFGLLLYLLITYNIYQRVKMSIYSIWPQNGLLFVSTFMLVYIINSQFIVAHDPGVNIIFYGTLGIISGLANNKPLNNFY